MLKYCIVILILLFKMQTKVTLTLSCKICNINCGYTYCLEIGDNKFSKQFCPSSPCDPTSVQTVKMGRCQYDMIGTQCSTSNQCVYIHTKNTCMTSVSQCSNPLSYKLTCDSCTSSACSKCLITTLTNYTTTSSQQCIGNQCYNIPTSTLTVSSCPGYQDDYGKSCSCCASIVTSQVDGASYCAQSLGGAFVDYQLYKYVGSNYNLAILYSLLYALTVMIMIVH